MKHPNSNINSHHHHHHHHKCNNNKNRRRRRNDPRSTHAGLFGIGRRVGVPVCWRRPITLTTTTITNSYRPASWGFPRPPSLLANYRRPDSPLATKRNCRNDSRIMFTIIATWVATRYVCVCVSVCTPVSWLYNIHAYLWTSRRS
jgi:hypothetical protein